MNTLQAKLREMERYDQTADELAARRWLRDLQTNSRGEAKGNFYNVVTALEKAPELRGIIAFEAFTRRMMLMDRPPWEPEPFEVRSWRDSDDGELLAWLQDHGIPASATGTVAEAVRVVAKRHEFDALADYLSGLEWDSVERLSFWLTLYLDAEDSELVSAIGRKWLISAVARALDPGCQADHALMLEGRQGAGKTETARILGGAWTQEHLPDLHSKDAEVALAGAWIVELSELAAMSRSEAEAAKSFLTRRVDKYRPPYARHVVEQPRRCVFLGTTNEPRYLRDSSGNRRFWPVEIGKADLAALRRDRDQLFAEAVRAYRMGEAWHLTDTDLIRQVEAEQSKRMEDEPWIGVVSSYCEGKSEVTTRGILDYLELPTERMNAGHAKRIANILRRLGWSGKADRTGDRREVKWTR